MKMTKKGLLALTVAAVVAGGTGTAIAAGTGALGSGKPTDDAWVQALAKKLGTTPDKLVEALSGVANDRIDALVKAGTITQAQADKLKERVAATGGLGFRGGPGRGGFGGPGDGGPGPRGGLGDPLAAAADYLGLTADALDTKLDAGTKLADIVKAQAKTEAGLKAALVAAANKAIDGLTGATDAQKKTLKDGVAARVDAAVASSLGHDRSAAGADGGFGPLGGPGFGGRGHGGRGHDGFGGRGGHGGGLPGFGGSGGGSGSLPPLQSGTGA